MHREGLLLGRFPWGGCMWDFARGGICMGVAKDEVVQEGKFARGFAWEEWFA